MGGSGSGWGGQSGCERRIEVFVKIQKKKFWGWGGWGGGGRLGGGGGRGRVDVNKELKFLRKFKNKNFFWGGGVGGSVGGVRLGESGWM